MPHAQREACSCPGEGFSSCLGILRHAGFDSGYVSLFCEPIVSAFHGQCLRVACHGAHDTLVLLADIWSEQREIGQRGHYLAAAHGPRAGLIFVVEVTCARPCTGMFLSLETLVVHVESLQILLLRGIRVLQSLPW